MAIRYEGVGVCYHRADQEVVFGWGLQVYVLAALFNVVETVMGFHPIAIYRHGVVEGIGTVVRRFHLWGRIRLFGISSFIREFIADYVRGIVSRFIRRYALMRVSIFSCFLRNS